LVVVGALALVTAVLATTSVAGATADSTPPVLVSFTITPTTIDTSAGPATITATGAITDDASGLRSMTVTWASPGDLEEINTSFFPVDRVSGTATDGVYVAAMTLPTSSVGGTWTIKSASLQDVAFNQRDLTDADFAAAGFDHNFTNTGSGDTQPVTIESFTLSPRTIDTTTDVATIHALAHIVDNQTGLRRFDVLFRSPRGDQDAPFAFFPSSLVSGTPTDGWYEATFTFPKYSKSGTWRVLQANATDLAFNFVSWDGDAFAAAGYDASFVNEGQEDAAAPEVLSFTIEDRTVDATSGPATLVANAHITDDLSGFERLTVLFESSSGFGAFFPFFAADRVSGTSTDGWYRTTSTLAQGATLGTWHMVSANLQDNAFSFRSFSPAQWIAAGFDSSFENSDQGAPTASVTLTAPNAGVPDGEGGWFVSGPVNAVVTADDRASGGSPIASLDCNVPVDGDLDGSALAEGAVDVTEDGVSTLTCTATDAAGNASAPATTDVRLDTVAPTLAITPGPDDARTADGWYNAASSGVDGVEVQVTTADATSGVDALECWDGATLLDLTAEQTVTLGDGSATVTCQVSDVAGNVTVDAVSFAVDQHAPTLASAIAPAHVRLRGPATASPNGVDPAFDGYASGIASAMCDAVDTTTVGPHAVTCTAVDIAGNGASVSVDYTVEYRMLGFFSPAPSSVWTPGESMPLRIATMADASGRRIKDKEAAALAARCAVTASATGAQSIGPVCLRYDRDAHQFVSKWRLGAATGAVTVTATVSYLDSATTTSISSNVTVS
jgi:hypothetical protein